MTTSLHTLLGHPLLLAFQAVDWDPFQRETLALYQALLGRTFGIEALVPTLARHGDWCELDLGDEHLRFPLIIARDAQGDLAEAFGVRGREAVLVIDASGDVRWKYVGHPGVPPKPAMLAQALADLKREFDAQSSKAMELSRRHFAVAALAIACVAATSTQVAAALTMQNGPTPDAGLTRLRLKINGTMHELAVEPRVTLLDALREHLNLIGTKKGCDHGQCGACTVMVDGRRINSCLSLAVMNAGKEIITIEGLGTSERLHPLQAAFLHHDGFQCGYCTPGQIMSAYGLLKERCGPTDADVREGMSGNICRCGAYPNIVAAIQDVRRGDADRATI